MEEHHGIYGIVALIAVFAAAGVFFTLNAPSEDVVYVPQVMVQSQVEKLSSPLTRPFTILGKSITGAVTTDIELGNGTVNFNASINLNMSKNTITCTAEINAGATSAYLNTCNDNGGSGGTANSGGAITCDSGTSKSTDANISACDGGFRLENSDAHGKLQALLNTSTGPVDLIKTYLYNISGCTATCTTANSSNLVTLNASYQTLCNNMTSGGALCQCIGISITSAGNVVNAKSGVPITFKKQDNLVSPAVAC